LSPLRQPAGEAKKAHTDASLLILFTVLFFTKGLSFPNLFSCTPSLSELTALEFSNISPEGKVSASLECENVHLSPLRQPAGEAKKAHTGFAAPAGIEKSLYFFVADMVFTIGGRLLALARKLSCSRKSKE
jgi:hypothetical protein